MTQAKFFENDEKGYFEEEEEFRAPRKPGEAPDGGWGWVVMLGALLCNLIAQGLFMSYHSIEEEVESSFREPDTYDIKKGVIMESSSLIIGPLVVPLVKKYGHRKVTMSGAVVSCIGLLVSGFVSNHPSMRFTYGVLTGVGLGLVYLPSIIIVAVWFENRRALATGLATMGAGVGYFIFQAVYESLLKTKDWSNATVIIAAVTLHCAVGGALYRPLTHAKPKGMKRGIIQRGAIMKALIAEKERQRTISNGSLDNCIITKDNRLIKIDKIDLRNKSSSYINRLKETFGFSSRSLNRSKNSLVVPKVVVDPIYKPKPSPKTQQKVIKPKPASTPPTPKRDSGCGGSLDSPNFRARSYEALATDDPWNERLVVGLPEQTSGASASNAVNASLSDQVLSKLDAPKPQVEGASFLSANVSPVGSGRSINMKTVSGSVQSGAKNIVIPIQGSVMTVSRSSVGEMNTIYEEEESQNKVLKKINKWLNLELMKSPTYLLFLACSCLTIIGFAIPYANLPKKALSHGVNTTAAYFMISIFWVVNMIGRILVGWTADRLWASSVHLNNFLLVAGGIMSFFSRSFHDQGMLSFYAALFGLFTAGFVTLRSIMLIELFGKENLLSAFGLVTFFQGFFLLAGYKFAALLPGDVAFYVAGACLTVAGVAGFFLHRMKMYEERQKNALKIVDIEEISVGESFQVENCESTI